MEALIIWLKVSVFTVFLLIGFEVNAQKNEINFDEKILKSISKYEATKNKTDLFQIRILGQNNEIALNWLEKNMSDDEEIFHVAALAFSESGNPKWNSRAESMLLKSLKIRPNSYTALKLGYINLNSDKLKACNFFKQANDIDPTSLGNEEYGFCLMPAFDDRIHRKSDSDACAIFKIMANEYWKLLPKNHMDWYVGRVYFVNANCLKKTKTNTAESENLKESIEWYKRGMISGHEYSALYYAEHLENGLGVFRDTKGAIEAYKKAASLGLNVAQNRLGVIYAEGTAGTKNLVEAYKWFLIATSNGYEPATDNRNRAESKLTKAEMRSAELEAKKWLEANPN